MQQNDDLYKSTDRGCQYASGEYIKLLNDNAIRISMAESTSFREDQASYHYKYTLIDFSIVAEGTVSSGATGH